MAAQGSQIIDLDYFLNLRKSVEGVNTCAELQDIVGEVQQTILDTQSAIALELAKVQPLLALLTAPGANLGQIVGYIQNLITSLITPMAKPAITYAAQLAAIAAEIGQLSSAIQEAADRIGSCSVSLDVGP